MKRKKTRVIAKKAAPKKAVKKAAPKKAAKKKATSYHKDTNSHNVKLTIMSGLSKGGQKLLNQWQFIYGNLAAEYIVANLKRKKELQREMKITREIISRLKKIK